MRMPVEVHCIACPLAFCCVNCRRAHERNVHLLRYECPICRLDKFLCSADNLQNEHLLQHLAQEHFPLHCNKCGKIFASMDDFVDLHKCNNQNLQPNDIDEDECENEVTTNIINEEREIEDRFNSLYERASTEFDADNGENFEAIVSINRTNKTAIITPVFQKNSKETSRSEEEDDKVEKIKSNAVRTPYPKAVKTPRFKRTATPHVKKFLMRQLAQDIEEDDDSMCDNDQNREPPNVQLKSTKEDQEISGIQALQETDNSRTPSRVLETETPTEELHTPTSHTLKVDKCAALASAVTTSTPTHPATSQWALFPEPGADSPLSEIEGTADTASPGQQSSLNESSKGETDSNPSKAVEKKLKSIIITGPRPRLEGQDSSEKQVTFADSACSSECSSVNKTKKVKFADDTKFDDAKPKRVFRRPKRLLTPGPQRTRKLSNPHFQALLNRFETHQGTTLARTPTYRRDDQQPPAIDLTPAITDLMTNLPARAINFKDESPQVEEKNIPNDSPGNELFKSCIDSPDIQPSGHINTAIAAFTTNIAGSIQTCLSSALQASDDATEIQFKFVITKKKVSVKRIVDDGKVVDEKTSEFNRQCHDKEGGDNIWTTITRAVKNVFWNKSDDKENLGKNKPSPNKDTVQANGVWGLPAFVCDFYIAMDVTCSTSSIFNLVAISVDRYIAVTQPIKYAKHKNNRRVWMTIVLVWLISAAIGLPIVLGLNNTPDRRFDECLFNSRDYVIYSSLSSFYIPCIMMMFLYYNIFKALRNRAKKQRAARKPPTSGEPTATGGATAVVIENVAQTRRLAETALHDDRPTNTASGSNEDDQDEGESFDRRSVELEADTEDCHVIPNDKSTEFILATVVEEAGHVTTLTSPAPPLVDPNGNNDSGYAPSNLEDTIKEQASSPPPSPLVRHDATVLQNQNFEDAKGSLRKNGSTRSPRVDKASRTASTIVRCAEELTRLSSAAGSTSSKKERKATAAATRFTIYKVNKASKKKREKSSAKKERKATKTLAIVLGVFLFCWAPFFSCSVLDAVCGKLGAQCSPGVTAFILTTWLGYINSFLNPVIYTIFNPEFRKAFKKIMHCGT